MGISIRKAKRSATKLRLLLTSPSGGGKTYSGLLLAKGLGGRTVVIDTEEGSSDLYDQLHEFDVVDLKPPFTPERYIEAIHACEEAGYDVIVIDSVTHCWSGKGGCLELVDDIAKAKFRGNTWSAFSEITPRWRAFVDAILRSSAHVICTGRSKTETAQVDDGGRKKVTKLGMKLEARDGLEYEFTCVLDIIHDGHYATVSKDRTGLFTGDPKPITEKTGKQLSEWLAGGKAVAPQASPLLQKIRDTIAAATTVKKLGAITDRIDQLLSVGTIETDQWSKLTDEVNARHDQIEPVDAGQEAANAVA
jgi:hypothetical protein